MAFSYESGTDRGRVRLLIGDRDPANPVFTDAEIDDALYITSSQGIYSSGQLYVGWTVPANPVNVTSVYMAAAVLCESRAALLGSQAGVVEVLDVKLSMEKAATELRNIADCFRSAAIKQGHVAIAEVVYDQFGARERVWKQLLRLEGA